jgi:hypothetical protein
VGELRVVVRRPPCPCPHQLVYGTWTARHMAICPNRAGQSDNNDLGVSRG